MSDAAPGAQPQPQSSLAYGWLTVGLLTVAYIFSFIDRYVLGLLIEPIKADLDLTDTQIGLLLGPAFAIFYATMGLPLGWLADRKNRVKIVAVGIAVWSIATAASGLARNFTHLFIARMSIGVGEATLSPCAMSIISDSFPPEKRSRPIAVYTMALSVGAGFASLLGAGVLTWAKSGGSITLPGVGNWCRGRPLSSLWGYRAYSFRAVLPAARTRALGWTFGNGRQPARYAQACTGPLETLRWLRQRLLLYDHRRLQPELGCGFV